MKEFDDGASKKEGAKRARDFCLKQNAFSRTRSLPASRFQTEVALQAALENLLLQTMTQMAEQVDFIGYLAPPNRRRVLRNLVCLKGIVDHAICPEEKAAGEDF